MGRGPLIEHNLTAPYRSSREIINLLEAEGGGVEILGLVGKTPWDKLCDMALTFCVMSSPTVQRCISALAVRFVAIFNYLVGAILRYQNEECHGIQNTIKLINFKNSVNLPENMTLTALAVDVKIT